MRLQRPLIAQIEFFPPQKPSLGEALADAERRILDTGRSKTVVRIWDEKGSFQHFLENRLPLEEKPGVPNVCEQILASLARRFPQLHQMELASEVLRKAQESLLRSLTRRENVAVERVAGERFQEVRENEKHELLESINRASGVWVFMFAHDDLYASSPGPCVLSYM